MRLFLVNLFLVGIVCGCTGAPSDAADASVADAGVFGAPKGPLANLPSAPGAHIAKIKALADNTWINLGAPQGDSKWGVARGRSWGGRAFVLAPELRGAFYYGEGRHGFVKPDGYTMDDMWVYDINAHRWIVVYPGTHAATFTQSVKDGDLKIDQTGQLADKTGYPVPIHTLIHAWDFLTYDTSSRKFGFVAGNGLGRYYLGNEALMDEGLKLLDAQRVGKPVPPMSPWFYDTVAGRFERYPVSTPTPAVGGYANFQYVKSRKQYFYGGSQGVAYFDPVTRKWTTANDTGPRPVGYDHGGAHDEKRDRIYMGVGYPGDPDQKGSFYIYDLKLETWTRPSWQLSAPPSVATNGSSILYDVKNDVVTVFRYGEKKIYTYVPATGTWSSQAFPAAVLSAVSYPSVNAFYDPELNAYFCYLASDSDANGMMWAYRFKK